MFVMTLDQKNSRSSPDGVPALLGLLADLPAVLPFERTVGDEVQGVLEDPAAVTDAALRAVRDGRWHVGIGVGAVRLPLPAASREGAGEAFVAARSAVDRAKKSGARPGVAVEGGPAAPAAEAVLVLLARLVQERSEAEWRILDELEPGRWGAQSEAARRLGITSQSVSKASLRAGWEEEWAARPVAAHLLAEADRQAAASAGPAAGRMRRSRQQEEDGRTG